MQPGDPCSVADRVAESLSKGAAEADRTGAFPVGSLQALRGSGLMALLVPAEFGGSGGDVADLAAVAQRLATGCLSTTLAFVMHCQQVDAIVRFGSAGLQERVLPRVCGDGMYIASVTAERGTGGLLLQSGEALQRDGDGFQLTRHAPVVTGGAHADAFLVKMQSAAQAETNDVSLVFLDRDELELETGPGWDALGMRGTENVAMVLRGRVDADRLVGGLGGFRRVAIECFAATAHIGWAAAWLGAARAGFSGLLREVRAGRVRSIDHRSDLASERIALVRTRLESVSAYLHCVVEEVRGRQARGETLELPAVQIHLNTLKVLAARETFRAADEMIDLAGIRFGYLRNESLPLERLFRDLRAASLTYDDHLLLVSNGSLSLLDPAVTTVGS
jgi:acyl-CoA dehydrogenase